MIQAYVKFWKNYVNFSGRARRSDYWWVVLVQSIIMLIFYVIMMVMAIGTLGVGESGMAGLGMGAMAVYGLMSLYSLATFIPTIALMIRRLHDLDKAGWWILISFIPCIGSLVLFIFFCLPGTQGPNRFGDDPLMYV